MAQRLEPVASREPLVELFSADRATHPYGLADLEEPFWTGSRWWLDGDACVGLLRLPASDVPVVYSVSARAPAETLDLLVRVLPELPDHFIINGPPGLSDRLAGDYDAVWVRSYRKMHLAHPDRLPPPDPEADELPEDNWAGDPISDNGDGSQQPQ